MRQHRLIAPPQAEGMRLDSFLAQELGPEVSRAAVQRLMKQGLVEMEGAPARPADRIRPGQRIVVSIPPAKPLELLPRSMDLWVLHEDEHLIVVNKPAGLVVHPGPGNPDHTLVAGLLHHCKDLSGIGGRLRPGIVHRLDKDTSGALVAAKSEAAHRGLVAAFASGQVHKQYLALVHGAPPAKGSIDKGIGRHPVDRKRMSSAGRRTKAARTQWRVVRRFAAGLSLLRVEIATGRTHQIRVHLAEAGFPVVNDKVYGGRKLHKLPPGPAGRDLASAKRQLLHAVQLGFAHPVSGQRLDITAPLPEDFRSALRGLLAADELRQQ